MRYVELGTPIQRCPRCGTPIVEKDGQRLYCYGAPMRVEITGKGNSSKSIDVQDAIVHNCERDAADYRALKSTNLS